MSDFSLHHHRPRPPKVMNLTDAITAVEKSQSAYQTGVTTTTSDQTSAAAVQAKLDAAQALVSADIAAQTALAVAANADLDALEAAIVAARIPVA